MKMQHFRSSIAIAVIGLVLGFYIGGLEVLYIVALLAILEISLSFDNAVVNVKILETMEEKWQKRFITFGIPIAVFGMRFLFPVLIVAISSGLSIFDTFNLALNEPSVYQETLHSVEKLIFAFGGSFLLMVFFNFIFDTDREEKWIKVIENSKFLDRMGALSSIQMIMATIIGLVLIFIKQDYEIALAYFSGVLLYSIIASLDDILGMNGVRNGIMGFLYLEVLDASFSFDGVIGAFALSSDIFVIMIGLGIGAMFVRSLTLFMLKKKTLAEYRYLEHGAHYAVLALAIIMLVKIFTPIDEIIVGTIGVAFIAAATYHSIRVNKRVKVLVDK
jgi:hypothetical protein